MNLEVRKMQADVPVVANVTGLEPLRDHARKAAALDGALGQLADISDAEARKRLTRLRGMLKSFEPSVTIIGQVKAGKTSLLNAMIGWPDLLPADVNPWTSVVTSMHLDPGKTGADTAAKFSFFGSDEWSGLLAKGGRLGELACRAGASDEVEKLRRQLEIMQEKSRQRLGRKFELLLGQQHDYQYFDKELIERYVCLGELAEDGEVRFGDAQGRFADVTKSADLYLRRPEFPTRLCIRDTPGVNDTFMIREQTTIRAIRESRLCVVVLSAHQALSTVDMALIRLITNIKSREVVIFVNRIDELSDPARQILEIRDSIVRTLKDHRGPEQAQIVFGSAHWATCALERTPDGPDPEMADLLAGLPEVVGDAIEPECAGDDGLWMLSGVPNLFRAVSDRIVEGEGRELIAEVARSAANIANGMHCAAGPDAGNIAPVMATAEINATLARMEEDSHGQLEMAFEQLRSGFASRLDSSHRSFLDRATGSLVSHLERRGEDQIWEYSPDGLRMMLGSANAVFGARVQKLCRQVFETAATDIAGLYQRAFTGFTPHQDVLKPGNPRLPPPVFLGQTIALDLKGPWWKSWWRKRRSQQALAESFLSMIKAETDPIVDELKLNHTDAILRDLRAMVAEFYADQRAVMAAIPQGAATPTSRGTLDETLGVLNTILADHKEEI